MDSGDNFSCPGQTVEGALASEVFEVEAVHYGVRLHYADAPSGNDPGSQFARSILAHAAKLVKLANRKNAVHHHCYTGNHTYNANARCLILTSHWGTSPLRSSEPC